MAVRAPRQAPAQTVRAEAKWVRCSARKARLVLDNIRGQSVPQAVTTLAFTQRAAAHDVAKVLRSAIANAEANHGLNGEDLVVHLAYADEGPALKRWRARARGRVNRIHKQTCHITVVLAPDPGAPARPATAEETRRRGLRRGRGAEVAAAETTAPEAQAVEAEAPVADVVAEPEAPAEPQAEQVEEAGEPEAAAPTAGVPEEAPSAEAAAPAAEEPETEEKPKRSRAKKTEEEA